MLSGGGSSGVLLGPGVSRDFECFCVVLSYVISEADSPDLLVNPSHPLYSYYNKFLFWL